LEIFSELPQVAYSDIISISGETLYHRFQLGLYMFQSYHLLIFWTSE